MIPRFGRPEQAPSTPLERVTSMCLGINDWSCADCVASYCTCSCHKEAASCTSAR